MLRGVGRAYLLARSHLQMILRAFDFQAHLSISVRLMGNNVDRSTTEIEKVHGPKKLTGKRNETIGLPIGPGSSSLAIEIIPATVNREPTQQMRPS